MSYATFHDELSATMVLPEPGLVVFAAGASGSVFKQVMQGLLNDGVKVNSLAELIAIATLIVHLVQEVGPQVVEIIDRVKVLIASWKK